MRQAQAKDNGGRDGNENDNRWQYGSCPCCLPGERGLCHLPDYAILHHGGVASDAIPEPDASQMEGNGARQPKDKSFAGAQRTQNLVFPVTLTPARNARREADLQKTAHPVEVTSL